MEVDFVILVQELAIAGISAGGRTGKYDRNYNNDNTFTI